MKSGFEQVDNGVSAVLSAAANRFGAEAVSRIARGVLPKFEPVTYEDERQRSTWLHAPGLTARPWWQKEQCGRLVEMIEDFEHHHVALRDEMMRFNAAELGTPYDHISVSADQLRGWVNLFFYKDYEPNAGLLERTPVLRQIVERYAAPQLDRFELWLSVLQPGTHIPPHFGGTNLKLTLHLPLSVPEGNCALRVDSDTRGWTEGRMSIFDDSFEHEAWNRTSQNRAVLLIKAYHPELSVEEVGVLEMLAPLNAKFYREMLKTRPGA